MAANDGQLTAESSRRVSSRRSRPLIPAGYTFLNTRTFMSVKACDMVKDLFEKLDKRDPDMFDMYIYNDFFGYGQIDLVDKQLSSIHSKIIKKDWDGAFHLLEAFSIFTDFSGGQWANIDDGMRVQITDKAYGACLVTILRALHKENRLDVQHFPSLETLLKAASSWGRAMMGFDLGGYTKVVNGIGLRLFSNKAEETIALEEARVKEWIASLPKEEQKDIKEALEEDAKDEDGEDDDGPWYGSPKDADENEKGSDYTLSRVWKEYKAHLQGCPTKPLRGPPEWDLSKWSSAQKAAFSFHTLSSD